jgi:hypothetical protein
MEPEKFGYSTVAKHLKQATGRKRGISNIEQGISNVEVKCKV